MKDVTARGLNHRYKMPHDLSTKKQIIFATNSTFVKIEDDVRILWAFRYCVVEMSNATRMDRARNWRSNLDAKLLIFCI